MERLLIVYEWMLNYYNESFDEKFDVKDDIINIHNASICEQANKKMKNKYDWIY